MRCPNVTPTKRDTESSGIRESRKASGDSDPRRVHVDPDDYRARATWTPAKRLGSHYSLVTADALHDLRETPNRARVFVLLASGWRKYRTCRRDGKRKGGPLAYSFRDLARWTGHCGRTLAGHLDSLVESGHVRVTGRGRYRVTGKGIRRTNADGRYVRLPIGRVPAMTGREVLVFATAAMSTTRGGRRLIRWREVAVVLGVSRRTIRRAVAALRGLGIALRRFAFRGPEKSVRSARKKVSGRRTPTGQALGKRANTGGFHPINGVRMALSAAECAVRRRMLKAQAAQLLAEGAKA